MLQKPVILSMGLSTFSLKFVVATARFSTVTVRAKIGASRVFVMT